MIRVDGKVIDLIEKIRKALKMNQMAGEDFPIDEIYNLIEYTLGESFWNCVGSQVNDGFENMPAIYRECLEKAIEREDMEECSRILYLFECTYRGLYAALNEEERIFREKPYRKMIIDLGTMNSQIQYRLHKERQKGMQESKEGKFLGVGRGVVYTYLLEEGGLNQPQEVNRQLDYLCFTNKKEKWGKKEGGWEYRPVEMAEGEEELLLESKCKILAHRLVKEYDYSIWVAQDVIIVGDAVRFCEVYGEGRSFLSFPSAREDCIYEDMSMAHMATDNININIRKAMMKYRKEGYPEHNGLIDGRVMARCHRDEVLCQMMEEWWKQLRHGYSLKENIFNYLAWKYKFAFSICNLFVYENPYFRIAGIDLDTREEL